jgi:hypothetical protein
MKLSVSLILPNTGNMRHRCNCIEMQKLSVMLSMTEQTTMDSVKFYRHVEPIAAPIPLHSEFAGFEYRTFQIVRKDSNYMLWSIELGDGSKPPIQLRSSFTNKDMAIAKIDQFLDEELRKLNTEVT